MSYEPTTWKDGDLVTSAKLNKLEQGVANGGTSKFVVNAVFNENNETWTLDKTAGEIIEAFQEGLVFISVVQKGYTSTALLTVIEQNPSEEYYFHIGMSDPLVASTLNDYPTTGDGE